MGAHSSLPSLLCWPSHPLTRRPHLLDVHPPHEPIHGVRDFFLHLFTITIGLLIALGLENLAERVHQHHLRDEADRNLQQELRDNEHELDTTRAAAKTEEANLTAILGFLGEREQNKHADIHNMSLNFTSGSLSSASWQTASATGALSYMSYERAEQFAGVYQVQDIYSRLTERTLDQFLKLQSYVAGGVDPTKMSPEDARLAATDVRQTLSNVQALDQIGGELRQKYEQTLTSPAR